MKAYSIDPETQTIEEIDIEMQANTTYSFFNSILIDDLDAINKHMVHTDSNSLSAGKKAFFIGEKLALGIALVVGKNGMTETAASISKKDLQALVRFEVSSFYAEVLAFLKDTDVDLYRNFGVEKDNKRVDINAEWVLDVFNIADDRTKEYFITELKKVINAKEDVFTFIQKLGQMAINAAR